MDIDTFLLLGILIVLLVEYVSHHTAWRRIKANLPYWFKEWINELRNR